MAPALRCAALAAAALLAGSGGVARAAAMPAVAQMVPSSPSVTFAQLYKLRYLSAASVAPLLRKSFANIKVSVVGDVNGIEVTANAADQQRIAQALAQLDVPQGGAPSAAPAATAAPARVTPIAAPAGATAVDVVTLHAAVPGLNGAPSTTAADIASVVTQTLGTTLPDLRVIVYAGQSQLLLMGSPSSIKAARDLIDKLDTLPQLVVLDVTILEVDESVSKNLGLSLTPALISTTYSEIVPAAPVSGGTPQLLGLQPLTRTPLSLGLTLNLLIQNGKAKVLADPKLTTLSGRTASIRSGDNIAILTTTGGSVGTVATTQLVTFNTGVQLDVTPVINADNFVTVTLHPTINNLSSILNGVPQISTRDTQTTVAMREGQTLVIGGLIEDSLNTTEQRIPVLGYLPLIGKLFTQSQVTGLRNDLIITVTPHIVNPLAAPPATGPSMTELPTPVPLPALAPGTTLPPAPAPSAPASVLPAAERGFVFGRAPATLPLAGPNDPPKLLYVHASPQVVRAGTVISIDAVTTPNVTRVLVQAGASTVSLQQTSPGVWSTTLPFSSASAPQTTTRLQAVLSAARADGATVTLDIPLTVLP